MDRLTRRSDTGNAYYPRCFEKPCNRRCEDCLFDETICKRLAAYEDTGLTPEEIDMDHEAAETLRQLCRGCDLDRLEELVEADKDGRVVVLPCKVGDTVWVILDGAKCVRRCVVEYATIGRYFTVIVFHTADRTREQYGVPAGAFGKTVFLTSEEAEKALKVMMGD